MSSWFYSEWRATFESGLLKIEITKAIGIRCRLVPLRRRRYSVSEIDDPAPLRGGADVSRAIDYRPASQEALQQHYSKPARRDRRDEDATCCAWRMIEPSALSRSAAWVTHAKDRRCLTTRCRNPARVADPGRHALSSGLRQSKFLQDPIKGAIHCGGAVTEPWKVSVAERQLPGGLLCRPLCHQKLVEC